jgi:glycosyltransferase involved in cell wall biosynthesis
MAMGKAIVANEEIFDQKETIEQSGGGILVPFKEEEFAMAIIDLLKDPEKMKEMGRKGREWVVKNRSYEILARRLEEEYFEVLKTVKTRT